MCVAKVRAVLCDLDGTLLDSNAQHAEAWQRAFAHFGIETTFDEVVHQIGKGGDNLIPVFVRKNDRERLQKSIEEFRTDLFRKEYLPTLNPFPGARELLIKMKQTDIRAAIASSSNEQDLNSFKRILNIEDLVEKDTSADDAERSKPEPDIFEAALRGVHLQPQCSCSWRYTVGYRGRQQSSSENSRRHERRMEPPRSRTSGGDRGLCRRGGDRRALCFLCFRGQKVALRVILSFFFSVPQGVTSNTTVGLKTPVTPARREGWLLPVWIHPDQYIPLRQVLRHYWLNGFHMRTFAPQPLRMCCRTIKNGAGLEQLPFAFQGV